MQELFRGAEAVIFKDKDKIVKQRLKKSYRLDLIDDKLRKHRTKREAKVLQALDEVGIPVPKLIETDSKESIEMEFIDGERLADSFDAASMKRVGEIVALMHDADIAHGDLTTSNMIKSDDIYLIDFGLSFFSQKIEDKAVDIHLLKEALEAKHFDSFEKALKEFKKGYKNSSNSEKVFERLEKVEQRGRYKKK